MPCAACIPLISSGDVSNLTSIVSCICSFKSSASSAENVTLPLAAPGDAGSPEAIIFFSAFSSSVGCNRVSNVFGSTLKTACLIEINFSFTISTAILIEAFAVLFPDRVCNIHNLSFSTVNSISCISL